MEYDIRFTPPNRPPRVMDLHLCTDCLLEFRRASDVEVLTPTTPGSKEDLPRPE
jgi:hypothetical protein